MAKSTISGLTVKIGAETKGFQDAIKEIDRVSKNIANDLKTVSSSMKLDPTAIQTYSDKFKLLQEAVEVSAKKVDLAKKAIAALDKDLADKKVSPEEYAKSLEALKRQLESSEYEYSRNISALREFEKQIRDATTEVKTGASSVTEANKSYTAFYEQTSKVSDGQKQLSENIGKASKSYLLFYEQTSKASKGQKELTDNIDKTSKSYLAFYEKTSKASDEQKELTDNINKSSRSYIAFYEKTSKASYGQNELNGEMREFADVSQTASTGVQKLTALIEGKLTAQFVIRGLERIVSLAKSIARHLAEAGKELAKFSVDSLKMAGEWDDATETSKRAFAEYADEAVKFAEDRGSLLGIYSNDILVAMNNLGLMFSSMGLDRNNSLQMSETVMNLAGDIRAAFGGDINDILEGLNSSFGATTRTLRQWGIYTSEAELKAYALEKGIVKVEADQLKLKDATVAVKEATEKQTKALKDYGEESVEYERTTVNLEKAEAKLAEATNGKLDKLTSAQRATTLVALATERLKDIEGQAVEESNKYPALINRTTEKFDELKKKIGLELIPTAENLLKKFNEFLDSEQGKQIFQDIIDQFDEMGKKIKEVTQDERFTNFVDHLIDSMPLLIQYVGEFVNSVLDKVPNLAAFADEILKIIEDLDKLATAEAWQRAEKRVTEVADTFHISVNTVIKATEDWAKENDLKLADVYNNWSDYEPFIIEHMGNIAGGTEDMETRMIIAMTETEDEVKEFMTPSNYTNLSGWETFWLEASNIVQTVMESAKLNVWDVINLVTNPAGYFGNQAILKGGMNLVSGLYKPKALGGEVSAGQVYRINDDAGHRIEAFVPGQNGYILNGNQVDRIVNNNNSRNFSGGVTINAYCPGLTVAQVADELGTAFYDAIRIPGRSL